MVLLVWTDGGKAAWESDAESGTDDGDDEAEAKRTRVRQSHNQRR